MTITTAKAREAQRLRDEIHDTQRRAREAIAALDVGQAIAHCRSLRSILRRAQNAGIDVAAIVQAQSDHANDANGRT